MSNDKEFSVMTKQCRVALFSLALTVCLFSSVSSVQAQNQPPHGPGSSGPPVGTYKNDQFHGNRINAMSMLSGPMYESAISDWNTTMLSSLSTYRIILAPTSRAARVGIENCDQPYYNAAMRNMRYIVGRIQEIRNQIDYTQSRVAGLINAAQQLQDDTIEAQGEPGLPLVGTGVEAVIDNVPVAGPMVNAIGDEDDRQVQVALYDAHQKKKRFRAWLPTITQLKKQTEELLALAQGDVTALEGAFQPDVCESCGKQAKAETPAPQVNLPPAGSLPPQPDLRAINKVIDDFNRVAQQTAAQNAQTVPGKAPNRNDMQLVPDNNYNY
jgi:hypothetical protein